MLVNTSYYFGAKGIVYGISKGIKSLCETLRELLLDPSFTVALIIFTFNAAVYFRL